MTIGATLLAMSAGCAPLPVPDVVTNLDRIRESKAVATAKLSAPRAFLLAEKRRDRAREAMAAGAVGAAQILGERAEVAYQQLVVTARVVRAEARRAALKADDRRLTAQLGKHEAELQRVRADVRALESKLALKVRSGDKNEVVDHALGAQLRQQARLLCVAARLLRQPDLASSPQLVQAVAELGALPTPVSRARAAEVRQRCLQVLVDTRRARADVSRAPVATDRLLTALSRAGWQPQREDAGIRVRLPSGPRGPSEATIQGVSALSAIASTHRGFSAILVIQPERALGERAAVRRHGQHHAIGKLLSERFQRFDVLVEMPHHNKRSASGSQQLFVLLVSPQ
jgi:hypothetical protein